MVGQTINRYRIVAGLGEGGMGKVYRAEDTTLGRTVALKFLADHLLHDAEAKQRFLREARAAAAITHPHICPIYEVGEEGGRTFLAMACLEGAPLDTRIKEGPLPLAEAVEIARQLADGLQAAHDKGVVHRDIKPSNVMVDEKNRATILDFGLARLTEASALTRPDQTVGTTAYMSPEQLQGEDVDRRTDIWSLGVTLYEMVAGVRPFRGQFDQALAYEIVNEEPPPLTGLRTGVPIELELLVGKCLAKDPADRYQSAAELEVDLRTLARKLELGRSRVLSATQPMPPVVNPAPRPRLAWLPWALLAVAVAALGVPAFLHWTEPDPPEPAPLRRFSFTFPGLEFAQISPDGRYIAFTAQPEGEPRRLWLRPLASETPRPLTGTEGVHDWGVWGPDSERIVFPADGQLKAVNVGDGSVKELCELPGKLGAPYAYIGAAWTADGRIIFSSGLELYEVPALGGKPTKLLETEEDAARFAPLAVREESGETTILFCAQTPNGRMMHAWDPVSGAVREVGPGVPAAYAPEGFLLHIGGQIGPVELQQAWASPFLPASTEFAGDPFPIAGRGAAHSVSRGGTLVYKENDYASRLVIRNRRGEPIETIGETVEEALDQPRVDTDGTRVAAVSLSGAWVYEIERGIRSRLADGSRLITWRSGDEVAYVPNGPGPAALHSRRVDGSEARPLLERFMSSAAWSGDGSYLVFNGVADDGGEGGIYYAEVQADGSLSGPIDFLRTTFSENAPVLSPDSRYLAYLSNESGRNEIYVRSFPDAQEKTQVSTSGGVEPSWSADGTELYYVEGSKLMAAPVSITGDGFEVGRPVPLFESRDLLGLPNGRSYDAFPDGRRFVTVENLAAAKDPVVRVVQNWYEEIRERE